MLGLAPGKRLRIFDAYIEDRQKAADGRLSVEEAMSTSDFPTYLSKFLRHTFLERFQEQTGVWTQYTKDFSVEDFEEYTSSRFGRFPDISQKPLNGPYEDIYIKEFDGEKIRLYEWGNSFSLTRQLIISDRLNKLSNLPQLLAEALARTISKRAVSILESNPTMFDGNALFSSAHNNLGSATALTANQAGAALLQALELKIDTQTDDEGYKIQTPAGHYLIVPIDYRWIIKALNENENLLNASNYPDANPVRGRYTPIEERFLTDANNYYMAADPKGPFGFLAHITLNGNTQPFLGVQDTQVRGILGGDDPYSFEFDEIRYKVRHDFEFKPVEWRGVAAGIPS